MPSHNSGNTAKKKSRRDFLATGIAGLAGSSLLAEQLANGAPVAGVSSGTLEQNRQSSEAFARAGSEHTKKGAGVLRGLMADAGRLPEDPSYYRRAIDFCSEWGMNAYLISRADDQGCAFRFNSHPELITHQNALTMSRHGNSSITPASKAWS